MMPLERFCFANPRLARTASLAAVLAAAGGCLTSGEDDADPPQVASATQDLSAGTDYMLVGLGGKCMDVAWGSSDNGTGVNLFDCNGSPAQRWHFAGSGSLGAFQALGKCLDIPSSNFSDGSHLQLWDCNGSNAQSFRMFDQSSSPYVHEEVRPDASQGFCVEVAGGFTDNWTPIQLFDCNGTESQKWYAVPAQSEAAPPPAPSIQLSTMTIRDHRGGQDIITVVPTVAYNDAALFEDGYRLYTRVNENQVIYGAWTLLATNPAQHGVALPATFQRPSELSNAYYEYKVVAFNAAGTSDSNIVSLGPPPPSLPTNIRVTGVDLHSATVTWNDNSNNEAGFIVYGPGSALSTGPNGTSVSFTNLAANTRVCFQVSAWNASGYVLADPTCVTTAAPPPPTVTTILVGLTKQISGSTIFYAGSTLASGTVTKIHVPVQMPVTGLYFVKPGWFASVECANLSSSNLVFVPAGGDLNLTALYGAATQAINGAQFAACGVFSQLVNVPLVTFDLTYQF